MTSSSTTENNKPKDNKNVEQKSKTEVTCHLCGVVGHLKVNCPQTVCLACGKRGHIKWNCPSSENSKKKVEKTQEVKKELVVVEKKNKEIVKGVKRKKGEEKKVTKKVKKAKVVEKNEEFTHDKEGVLEVDYECDDE